MADEYVLWALELDGDGWPVLAHRIVEDDGQVRVAACGRQLTAATHPRGWWRVRPGKLPLSGENDIHCGRDDQCT